ncbi:peptidoglycan-recognition protein LF-like [Macrosteles quadrilineatus]|uniref:peptidoglycan-recognition protein LF-like n=1 Tax=Macrosteles quadrilineatus TaxID=74068 RepID=UPI0023E28357|nr:peptidoglycan-recognition protein LF-like [Macrosteles quadrilineatus]
MFNRPQVTLPLHLVTREEWGAKPAKFTHDMQHQPVHHYVVEYAARRPCYQPNDGSLIDIMKKMQKNHMADKDCPDIKYNFVVGYDGMVYEGRGWMLQPTLPDKYWKIKHMCVFIGWIGKFTSAIEAKEITPPKNVVDVRRNLMHIGMERRHISHILRVFFIKQGNHKRKGDFSPDWE